MRVTQIIPLSWKLLQSSVYSCLFLFLGFSSAYKNICHIGSMDVYGSSCSVSPFVLFIRLAFDLHITMLPNFITRFWIIRRPPTLHSKVTSKAFSDARRRKMDTLSGLLGTWLQEVPQEQPLPCFCII